MTQKCYTCESVYGKHINFYLDKQCKYHVDKQYLFAYFNVQLPWKNETYKSHTCCTYVTYMFRDNISGCINGIHL